MQTVSLNQENPPLDLAAEAARLAAQETALLAELEERQSALQALVMQRCAVADALRKAAQSTPAKSKAGALNWKKLLTLKYQRRKAVKAAREAAFEELHLVRGWISWKDRTQILVTVELEKNDPTKLYWVKDGLVEILPHVEPLLARPGYKLVGISHAGRFSLRYFLLCAEDNSSFRIECLHPADGNPLVYEGDTLHGALEYIQNNLAR